MNTVEEIAIDGALSGWASRVNSAKIQGGAQASAPIVIAGDSRATCFPFPSIADVPLINAGMPGILVHDAINFCAQAAANVPGSPLTVLFLGINNCWLEPTDPQMLGLASDYAALVGNFRSLGRHVIATTPWPLEKGFASLGPDSAIITWSQYAASISVTILGVCGSLGVPCVDLNGQMRLADLTLMQSLSQDGVHPSALGAQAIMTGIEPVVRYYLNH